MFTTLAWTDMPELDESTKELISISSFSLYKIDGQYLLIMPGDCKCCYGDRKTKYFLIDSDGKFISETDDTLYKSKHTTIEIVKFKIPDRIRSRYHVFKN